MEDYFGMKTILIAFVVFTLAGCTSIPKRIGAETMDEWLDLAEYILCEGSSVGAHNRRYRTEIERKIVSDLCISRARRLNPTPLEDPNAS
jgi:hypothetical protein